MDYELGRNLRVEEACAVLERTPGTLRALLLGLPEPWTRATEGGGTWSPFDIVGHLIDGEETDWIPRMRHLLAEGPRVPFTPFDRFRHLRDAAETTLAARLDRFEVHRRENVVTLRGAALTEEDLDREGTHPAFGRVTLRQLLATWVVHDLDHLGQVARVMAGRYAVTVGPWREYLPILWGRSQASS
jgi:hypothetical protein